MENKEQMEYRFLGKTGLLVSVIGYGTAVATEQEELNKLIAKAYEYGINFFDCAEAYGEPRGSVEVLLGKALKALNVDREDLLVTTKIFIGGEASQVNRRGLSRKHLIEGTKASLKRLQLDYVDVLYAHRYDLHTPMEEICRAFDWLIRHRYALYWGTSEWPAQKIEEAIRACEQYRLIKPVVEQPEYSMLVREKVEKEFAGLFAKHKLGTTIWSPLAGGVLTGKYNAQIPEDSRMNSSKASASVGRFLTADKIDNTRRVTEGLKVVAEELGGTVSQLALAWTLKNTDVSTAIIGARKIEQLEDNIGALELVKKITVRTEDRIEEILKNQPEPEFDARFGKKSEPRRRVALA